MLRLLDPTERQDRARRAGHHATSARKELRAAAPRGADDLPGPVQLAEPAAHRRHDHRRAVPGAGRRAGGRRQGRGPGAHGARRPQPRALQPLPERVLRRPAPAHRHRPRDRAPAQAHRLRRAGLRPRRLDPGAGHQPARGPAGRVRHRLRLRRARPVGRPAHLRPGRGHVPRPHHGDRRPRRALRAPLHPYTHALLSAVPVPDPDGRAGASGSCSQGDLPSPINPPTGCVFHTRCWKAQEQCRVEKPVLRELRAGHQVACHFPVEKRRGQHRRPQPTTTSRRSSPTPSTAPRPSASSRSSAARSAAPTSSRPGRRGPALTAPPSSLAGARSRPAARPGARRARRPVEPQRARCSSRPGGARRRITPVAHRAVGAVPVLASATRGGAEEVELEQQLVLGDLLLRGHVRDAGEREHLVRASGGGQGAARARGCAPPRRCRR